MPEIKAIILAAGKGKRMHSLLPKVLHPLCGSPLINYSLQAVQKSGVREIYVVASKDKEDPVAKYLKKNFKVNIVYQPTPLGTGHAVQSCFSVFKKFKGYVLIAYGDAPLLRSDTLKSFIKTVLKEKATLGFITTELSDPTGYGRVIRDERGEAVKVVEEKEATAEEKKIRESNMGTYCVRSEWLFETLKHLKPHPITKEYYLTDIVECAIRGGQKLVGFMGENAEEFLGINSRKQLSEANALMMGRLVDDWMSRGIFFVDPRHVYLDAESTLGEGTIVHPQVTLYGKTKIGKNCVIECGSVLKDMIVGDGVHIKPYCVLEESVVEKGAQIGPFARLRPHSHVGKNARVGNFVELKKTKLGDGVKANHLTYLGDAVVGEGTNIGCGTITCNYDGVKKYPTKIGKKVFVGSDVQFVAPVSIGNGAYIGAGSTITKNVPSEALAIARGRQINKKGWTKDQGPRTKNQRKRKSP